jgi:tRNA modification GTPase
LWSEDTLKNYCDLIPADRDIVVLTKSDAVASQAAIETRRQAVQLDVPVVVTSSITELGLEDLCKAIRSVLSRKATESSGLALTTTAARCRESVHQAAASVKLAAAASENRAGDELVAGELRVALAELGKVVGAVYTDDLLDRIFKTFCIGK